MYAGGKQPFGPAPFQGIDLLLKESVGEGGSVLDLGAGYGRDALFLATERKCHVTAVEPAEQGVEHIRGAAARDGLLVTCECCYLEEFGFPQDAFDMVLMDSVLSFLDSDVQPAVIKAALCSLKPGGKLVIIGWPDETEREWVRHLVDAAGVNAEMVRNAEAYVTTAEFDGENVEMTWHVTVAERR